MLFNSWAFVLFLAIVLTLYHVSRCRIQNVILLIASYAFYSFWDWRFLALLAGSTLVDFVVAHRIDRATEQAVRKRLLLVSIAVNLGALGFFKYFDFFVESATDALQTAGMHANVPLLHVVLPVGISFYTFQTMAYTIDVYRREQKPETDFITYALYVAYFPQLVAGPIERAGRLLPQFRASRKVTQNDWNEGAQLILWGFVKKVAVADSLARHVDDAFTNPAAHDSAFLWLAMYCFAIQIYCDFSGYTDIARGVSRLFGIRLMENFRQPYFAANITQFWRRWHISLSTWLRDYLYVPLGGNRFGERARYRNLLITMLLGGLWHGAAWTFVAWGAIHGVLLAAHRYVSGGRKITDRREPLTVLTAAKIVLTFHVVTLVWIPFRADSWSNFIDYVAGLMVWRSESSWSELVATGIVDNLLVYGAVVFCLDLACWFNDRELPMSPTRHWLLRGAVYGAGLVMLSFVRGGAGEPFIYFQF